MAGRRANGVKIGPQGWVFSVYRIQVILGVIRCISDFQKHCASKTASPRVKDTSRSLCYPVLCGRCLPSCQAERQAPGLPVEFRKKKNQFLYNVLMVVLIKSSFSELGHSIERWLYSHTTSSLGSRLKTHTVTDDDIITVRMNTVKPVFKATWEIGTTWELRTSTPVPRPIQYMEMDLDFEIRLYLVKELS